MTADVDANKEALASAAERLRKELEFVQRMMAAARSLEDFVAVASAADNLSDVVVKQAEALLPKTGDKDKAVGLAISLTVSGLPIHPDWNWARAKRYFCNELKLRVGHVDKQSTSGLASLKFFDQASCDTALAALKGVKLGDVELQVFVGETEEARQVREAAAAEREKERAERLAGGGVDGKRSREGAGASKRGKTKVARISAALPSHINEAVCPLWKKPYGEQLVEKHARVTEALSQVTSEVHKRTRQRGLPTWVADNTITTITTVTTITTPAEPTADPAVDAKPVPPTTTFRTAAPVLGIIRSPQINHYRNKNEFSIGYDLDNKPMTGFLLGSFVDGLTAVADPSETRHASRIALSYAAAMTDFLRNSGTPLPPWNKSVVPGVGFWRLLLLREGRAKPFLPGPKGEAGPEKPPSFAELDPYKYLVKMQVDDKDKDDSARQAPHLPSPPAGPPLILSDVTDAEPPITPTDEVVVLVQVNPRHELVASNPKLMHTELVRFAKHMRAHAAQSNLLLNHITVQYHSGVSNAAAADAPIYLCPEEDDQPVTTVVEGQGAEAGSQIGCFYDSLCELKFRVSPTAFFQVNNGATCLLYKLVGEWAAPSPGAVLFDVCCGTGTIGISLAHRVHKVIGVDCVASAIEDARANASLNGITNAQFVCGKAEDVLDAALKEHVAAGREVVAVVDPPRTGLHKSVVRLLLACTALKRLVFVSCNPANLTDNLTTLCTPPDGSTRQPHRGGPPKPQLVATPFVPVKAVAVDLFPHTSHVECIVLLERP